MKQNFLIPCAMAMALLTLAGCSGSKKEAPPAASSSAPAASSAAQGGVTVSPLPVSVDPAHLDQCTVPVSFDQGDFFTDDTGATQLKVKVYAYDLYDLVDISTLKAGDQIVICQQPVTVTSVERDEQGTVVVNGGLDQGGYELVTNDDTTYYADGFDDAKQYYELGEATLPVAADFQFEDSSALDQGTQTYDSAAFLADEAPFSYHFTPNNTTITVQDGAVVSMQRVYNP